MIDRQIDRQIDLLTFIIIIILIINNDQNYHRVPIGIAHPVDDISFKTNPYTMHSVYQDTTRPFVVNRFPDIQMEMVDKVVVPQAAKEIMNSISTIKKHIARKNESEEHDMSSFKSPRINFDNMETIQYQID